MEDAEYDALGACAQAGFAVPRRESYYRIPTDPAVTGLAGAASVPGEVLAAVAGDWAATWIRLTAERLLSYAAEGAVP